MPRPSMNPPGQVLSGKTFRPTLPADRGPQAAARVAGERIRKAFCAPKGACDGKVGVRGACPAPRARATRSRSSGLEPLVDAVGRKYSYRVLELPFSKIVASHRDDGAPDPRARPEFQARTFSIERVRAMAEDLDVDRLRPEGQTPTIGAPVLWRAPDTGLYHVLAGNHRFVAMRLAAGAGARGRFRVIEGTLEQARELAAASQRSDAAPETLIERARAEVRSRGLTLEDLPRDLGAEPVTRDNVVAFLDKNRAFRDRLGYAAGSRIVPEEAAARVTASLVGLLPASTQEVVAAVGAKAEAAIAAAAPALLYLHREATSGHVKPVYDLLASFDRAARVFRAFAGRGISASKIIETINKAAEQPGLFGGDVVHEIDEADAGLVLGLASLEARQAPADAMAEAMAHLVEIALADSPHQSRMFGDLGEASRLDVVRAVFGVRVAELASRFRPAAPARNPARAAPRRDPAKEWSMRIERLRKLVRARNGRALAREVNEGRVSPETAWRQIRIAIGRRALSRAQAASLERALFAATAPERNPSRRDDARAEARFERRLARAKAKIKKGDVTGLVQTIVRKSLMSSTVWFAIHQVEDEGTITRAAAERLKEKIDARLKRIRARRGPGFLFNPIVADTKAEAADVRKALRAVLEAVESGKAVDMTAKVMLTADTPTSRWSLANRFIAFFHQTSDARGRKQWAALGRRPKTGAQPFRILGPTFVPIEEEADDAEPYGPPAPPAVPPDPAAPPSRKKQYKLVGFHGIPVFRVEDTEGAPLPSVAPRDPPPLIDVAKRLGVPVAYSAGTGAAWGYYSLTAKRIVLHTHHASTFFHELAHAAHHTVRPLRGGQDPTQEIVAEFCAAVLERLYLPESQHLLFSHASYIRSYTKTFDDRAKAARQVFHLLGEIDQVLQVILGPRGAVGSLDELEPGKASKNPPRAAPVLRAYRRQGAQVLEIDDGRREITELAIVWPRRFAR